MKRTVVTFCASLLSAAFLMAQGAPPHRGGTPPTAEQMADRRIQQLTTALELTTAQQAQAKTIFADEATAMQGLQTKMMEAREALQNAIKNTGLDADIERAAAQQGALVTQVTALQGKAQAKFRSILTADQKTKLDAFGGRGMGGPGGPMGGRPPMGNRF